MPLPRRITIDVVGVTFVAGYPQNLYEVERRQMFHNTVTVRLVREADNAVDSNAILVVADVTEDKDGYTHVGHVTLGHVPAVLAARLAPEMDAGERWTGVVSDIRGTAADRPGVSVTVTRVQSAEHTQEGT